jgi:hypothetical protein
MAGRAAIQKLAAETYNAESLILDADRDPVDVVLRRTEALWADLSRPSDTSLLRQARKQLDLLKARVRSVPVGEEDARFQLFVEVCALRRKTALANPLLDFDKILFVKRHKGTFGHMVDQFYGACARPGGGLFVLVNPFGDKPELRDVLKGAVVTGGRLAGQKLEGGSFLSPELSFDGQTMAFAYTECRGSAGHISHTDPARGHWDVGRSYHVFRAGVDPSTGLGAGGRLVQLTDGQAGALARYCHGAIAQGQLRRLGQHRAVQSAGEGDCHFL